MGISRQEVEKVSLLARLLLSEEELDRMTRQLDEILHYMELLGRLDIEGVEPMAHAQELRDVFREDRVLPSLERDAALANAPRRDGGCYLVPAVLGESASQPPPA
jgi:aspartyl-tRNA(Asn)/glutamyl-tRNA(Gln) amidotransferase subunit C